MTEHTEFGHPFEDVLREMHGDIKVVMAKVDGIIARQDVSNGNLATLRRDVDAEKEAKIRRDAHIDGVLSTIRWFGAAILGLMGVGVPLAALVLAIVMRAG